MPFTEWNRFNLPCGWISATNPSCHVRFAACLRNERRKMTVGLFRCIYSIRAAGGWVAWLYLNWNYANLLFFAWTELNSVRQTDSMSNLSDMSGNTAIQTGRPRMDVACVIDTLQAENLAHRKCALDELRQACSLVNANLQQIQVNANIFQTSNRMLIIVFLLSTLSSLRN